MKPKRLVSIGCNHGELANPKATEAVLKFVQRWKPEIRIHLGDNWDCEWAMSSKVRSGNGSDPVPDVKVGGEFLREFSPTTYCLGNHEDRILDLRADNHRAISVAANKLWADMVSYVPNGCKIIPYGVHEDCRHVIGGYSFFHGTHFGRGYLTKTADVYGNSVCAHAHVPGVARGLRSDHSRCYGVGTLCDIKRMAYADRNSNTLSWAGAILFGEIYNGQAHLCLWEWAHDEKDFRLPI